jgi:predicted nucleotidyltransferase
MKPSEALEIHRDAVRRTVNRYGLGNPRVFGSAARGEDAETSDLDLLVDPGPRTTLFDLGGLSEELKDLLGVPVDVVTSTGLHRRIRTRVLAEAKPVRASIVRTSCSTRSAKLPPTL